MKLKALGLTVLFSLLTLSACQSDLENSDRVALAKGDQCNTTSQCKQKYGDKATDCLNSSSNTSVCMCTSVRCDTIGNSSPAHPDDDIEDCDVSMGSPSAFDDTTNTLPFMQFLATEYQHS